MIAILVLHRIQKAVWWGACYPSPYMLHMSRTASATALLNFYFYEKLIVMSPLVIENIFALITEICKSDFVIFIMNDQQNVENSALLALLNWLYNWHYPLKMWKIVPYVSADLNQIKFFWNTIIVSQRCPIVE